MRNLTRLSRLLLAAGLLALLDPGAEAETALVQSAHPAAAAEHATPAPWLIPLVVRERDMAPVVEPVIA